MPGKPETLNAYAKNVTSQHGEDGILAHIIEELGKKMIKTACEFGAWDGKFASNVHALWHDHGWNAVLIEGDAEKFKELEKLAGKRVAAINKYVKIRGRDSLDDIFRKNSLDPKVGVLSIDIDSYDYHVWKNVDYVDAQIVVIEHNPNIPAHIEYFDPEGAVYLKCSVKALERLGTSRGYKLVCCTRTNSIFLKERLFDRDKFPEGTAETLFEPGPDFRGSVIFTGEDRNRYPVFSKKTPALVKSLYRFYYRVETALKPKKTFIEPPESVVRQIKSMGMDV
jgi:hypothetical protein